VPRCLMPFGMREDLGATPPTSRMASTEMKNTLPSAETVG